MITSIFNCTVYFLQRSLFVSSMVSVKASGLITSVFPRVTLHLTPPSWGCKWAQNNKQTSPRRLELNEFLPHYRSSSTLAFPPPHPQKMTPIMNESAPLSGVWARINALYLMSDNEWSFDTWSLVCTNLSSHLTNLSIQFQINKSFYTPSPKWAILLSPDSPPNEAP